MYRVACVIVYFNSRPSARGDQRHRQQVLFRVISIHAPPRGATQRLAKVAFGAVISIHAPPRGATCVSGARTRLDLKFQFTPLREGRRRGCGQGDGCRCISIHAPPRGATAQLHGSWFSISFQFTPLREGRPHSGFHEKTIAKFQFTPLREGRRGVSAGSKRHRDISIHAPPRGATFPLSSVLVASRISIHAPPRGATDD